VHPLLQLISLMNALLNGALPHVDLAIGTLIHESVGDSSKLLFDKLKVTKEPATAPLEAKDVIRTLELHMVNLAMRQPPDPRLPNGFANTTVGLDINLDAKFFMSGASASSLGLPTIKFTLPSSGMLIPSISFSVKWVDAKDDMVWWIDMEKMQLAVAFKSAPNMDWDVDVSSSLTFGFSLPSWLINDLTPTVANWFLSTFSVDNPLIIKLDDKDAPTMAAFAKVHAAATLIAREREQRSA